MGFAELRGCRFPGHTCLLFLFLVAFSILHMFFRPSSAHALIVFGVAVVSCSDYLGIVCGYFFLQYRINSAFFRIMFKEATTTRTDFGLLLTSKHWNCICTPPGPRPNPQRNPMKPQKAVDAENFDFFQDPRGPPKSKRTLVLYGRVEDKPHQSPPTSSHNRPKTCQCAD